MGVIALKEAPTRGPPSKSSVFAQLGRIRTAMKLTGRTICSVYTLSLLSIMSYMYDILDAISFQSSLLGFISYAAESFFKRCISIAISSS